MGLGKRGKQKTFKLATAMVETIVFPMMLRGCSCLLSLSLEIKRKQEMELFGR